MKNYIIIFLAFGMGLVSCKKDLIEKAEKNQVTKTATVFKEIKTSDGFNWSTQKDVELSIVGMETNTPIYNTLRITSVDGNSIYNTMFYKMETSSKIKVILPSEINEFKVEYGSIKKVVKVISGKADFDFLPVLTDEITE
jgi:archaellum biogenesis protein FlaJ (TadC family)